MHSSHASPPEVTTQQRTGARTCHQSPCAQDKPCQSCSDSPLAHGGWRQVRAPVRRWVVTSGGEACDECMGPYQEDYERYHGLSGRTY